MSNDATNPLFRTPKAVQPPLITDEELAEMARTYESERPSDRQVRLWEHENDVPEHLRSSL